jgi:hypothetical protein
VEVQAPLAAVALGYNALMMRQTTRKKEKKKPAVRLDLLWKELLESFFYAALEIFYPSLYEAVDREKNPVFLNKELRIPGARRGQRILDLLVDVPLKTGSMTCVLLHVEQQGEIRDEPFHVRMFKYACLIVLRLGRPFTALAIRTTPMEKSEELRYEFQCFESWMAYGYRTVFLDKLDEEQLLAMTHNPLSVAVVAAMRLRKAGKNEEKRFEYGREMLRLLKSRGYSLDVRHQVVQFIAGLVNLSAKELLEEFEKEMDNVLEEMESMTVKVPAMEKYLKKKSYEWGKKDGKLEGILEGKLEGKLEGILEGKLEGILEGKLEGKLEGILEGKLEGKLEGILEGILEGKKETARTMLADRMTPDLVSKFTGLSIEEVRALREQNET